MLHGLREAVKKPQNPGPAHLTRKPDMRSERLQAGGSYLLEVPPELAPLTAGTSCSHGVLAGLDKAWLQSWKAATC